GHNASALWTVMGVARLSAASAGAGRIRLASARAIPRKRGLPHRVRGRRGVAEQGVSPAPCGRTRRVAVLLMRLTRHVGCFRASFRQADTTAADRALLPPPWPISRGRRSGLRRRRGPRAETTVSCSPGAPPLAQFPAV